MPKFAYKPLDINRGVTEKSGLGGIPPECYVGDPPNRLVRVWQFAEKEWREIEPVDASRRASATSSARRRERRLDPPTAQRPARRRSARSFVSRASPVRFRAHMERIARSAARSSARSRFVMRFVVLSLIGSPERSRRRSGRR